MTKNKLYSIQAIRAVAAFLVCGFHGRCQLNNIIINNNHLGEFLFKKGSVGVGVFFMMSGFIIVLTTKTPLAKDAWNYTKNFLVKRFFRIAPLYYLLTILWLLLFFPLHYFTEWKTQSHLIHSFLFIPFENKRPSLFLGWTLNYEMFFYVTVAISLLFSNYRKWILGLLFTIIIILSYFTWELPYLKLITHNNMYFFMLGVFLGYIYPKIKTMPKKYIFPLFIISSLAFSSSYFSLITWTNRSLYLLMLSVFIMSIILLDELENIPFPKWLIFMGDISFSTYLVHPFILVGFEKLFGKVNTFTPFFTILSFIIQILLIICFSYIVYRFLEKKIIFWTNKTFQFKSK